jgi:DNA mismatch repair protein MutS
MPRKYIPKEADTKEKNDTGIYKEYFDITNTYIAKYGENTILLLQVGSFFEVYGMKNKENNIISGSAIVPFSQICQLIISEKSNGLFQNNQILMAGFRDYTLEKYLQKICENGYTAVVYVQEKVGTKVTRVFHSIHSAGTYVPYENDTSPQITNNIMCIWFETHTSISTASLKKTNVTCGVAVSNIFTGKSSIFEYNTSWMMNPTTFDELERCICTYSPSEVIIVSSFDDDTIQSILQYSGVKSPVVHKIKTSSETATKCATQKYVKYILSTYYGEECYDICREFYINTVATQAFCYLLHFIQEHNPNLVRKISIPDFEGTSDSRVLLINHTLKQLNIIDDSTIDGKRSGKYSSILSLLNKCLTPMGRRTFKTQLLMPSYNEEWLNREYSMIDHMLEKYNNDSFSMVSSLRKVLGQIGDIEKICRQLVLRRIYPSTFYNLHRSIMQIQQINMCFYESPELSEYLGESPDNMNKKCDEIIKYLNDYFILSACIDVNSMQNFAQSIIQKGIIHDLDSIVDGQINNINLYLGIRDALNKLIQKRERTTNEIDYVKEHETEKMGVSLQITNKRGEILKNTLNSLKMEETPYIEVQYGNNKCEHIYAKDIKLADATTANSEIQCPQITKINRELLNMKDKMNNVISHEYLKFIVEFEEKWLETLEEIAEYISKIDVLFCKVYIAREFNYNRPIIDDSPDCKSYVDARGLRHALIEHIQQNELYVANDICVGAKRQDGILLYGTNAVGKTSMIRSIGIIIIMAQAGMFVPCASMKYKPYTAIFSRILGNDNIFKGLSTFAVEMSELRTILKMADDRSLILGDELCSGTETESALSIFMAGLMHLHEKQSSFVFATHFHEIVHYDEIRELPNLAMKHLSVYFDRERDCLVYDRILKDGSGTKMYGLEVCKSLYLPEEFLQKAHELRNKYYPETQGGLQMKSSRYNSKKIRGLCEICNQTMGEEVHHLQEQKHADENGFIGGIHKNHPANLLSICEKCHDKIHASSNTIKGETNKVVRKKKTTKKEYIIE